MKPRKNDTARPVPKKPMMTLSAGAKSEKGRREENQDRMTRFQSPFGEVVLVADGMGGHLGGGTAAEIVVRKFPVHLGAMSPVAPLTEALQEAAKLVNLEIYQQGRSGDSSIAGMGSTLVLAVVRETPGGHEVVIANAGDSRAYLFRGGSLQRLSKDHTAVQRLIDSGMLTEAESREHPEASVLTRAMGHSPDMALEIYQPAQLQSGDELLLCSDGLSGFVNDADIERRLQMAGEPGATVGSLVELALASGSDDNITVQLLRVSGPAAPVARDVPPVLQAPPLRKKKAANKNLLLYGLTGVLAVACCVGVISYLPVASRSVENKELELRNVAGTPQKPQPEKPKAAVKTESAKKKAEQPAEKGVKDPEPVATAEEQVEQPHPTGVEHPDPESAKPAKTKPTAKPDQKTEQDPIELDVYSGKEDKGLIDKIGKAANVRYKAAKEAVGRYKQSKNQIRLFYRPEAEAKKDRLLKMFPALRGAEQIEDSKIGYPADMILVLPSRGVKQTQGDPQEPDAGKPEKSEQF